MKASFRDFLKSMTDAGELRSLKQTVDVRDVSALIEQSPKALLFNSVADYPDWRVVGGLITSRARLSLAMGVPERQIPWRIEQGLKNPIAPVMVENAACQEVVHYEPDLSRIPYPLMHDLDGGPYLSGTFVVSKDPEHGRNCGSYRLMYRSPTETGIDLVSPSDMRFFYQRKYEKGEPLEIAVAIGTHPFELLSASYKAPTGLDEYSIAGGLHKEPVQLVKCKTVDLEVPADAELVLEGELLPIGWTADEGPFGEFNHISGDVKWNPIFRVKCITHRKNPILYLLQMPWENDWLCAPVTEANGLVALRSASVQAVDIRAPVGGCGYWTLIASIRKRPGEGKNALLALLSVAEVKIAIVTDEDIDIHNPDLLDWALALRVQPENDVIMIGGARGKHVDPSVRSWEAGKGGLPLTSKIGIDATIPEGIPRKFYQRLRHYGLNRVKLEDFE
jgi:2,5-furandicarboxylate decarboxylase 1